MGWASMWSRITTAEKSGRCAARRGRVRTHIKCLGGHRWSRTSWKRQLRTNLTSARYGGWHKDKKDVAAAKTSPRIIVFVVGGTTYSEMRAAYEVSADKKNWEIVMGGTHIMTPEEFLDSVKDVAGGGDDEE